MRLLVACPGRGSYDRGSLGTLVGRGLDAVAVVDAIDAYRAALGRPTATELDGADTFRTRLHVAGEHASVLTFACSLADLAELSDEHEIVGVLGNSMGWYTALVAAGALSLREGLRLVETMGAWQADDVIGGQLLYPTAGADWRSDPERVQAVEEALEAVRAAGHGAWHSIRLGGFAVLGADAPGIKALLAALPPIELSGRSFPIQLPLHSAFHTPLMAETRARAEIELADLDVRAPRVPLFDGRGAVFRPTWADPAALRAWTLGEQVTATFDFDAAVVSALHHTAPDAITLLGPGNTLGGPLARILVRDGWGGASTREAFEHMQSERSLLRSFAMAPQRRTLTGRSA